MNAPKKWQEGVEKTKSIASNLQLTNFSNNKTSIKVSIIIPVYNVETTIIECLDSVLNQSLNDIEIICVNDGSRDNSLEILKEYSRKDSRVKIISKDNRGYGHSINIGIDYATGEYIGIVESDDYVAKGMFEELYKYAKIYDLDFIKSDYDRFITKNNQKIFTRIKSAQKGYYNRVIDPQQEPKVCKFNMQTWCGIYSHEFIINNNIRHNETPGASFQDNGFYYKTYILSHRIYFIDIPSYYYRFDNPYSSVHDKGKVYVIAEEFNLIQQYLEDNKITNKNAIDLFYWKKYNSYLFTITRVDDQYKKEFARYFRDEYAKLLNEGILDKNYYSKNEWKVLQEIISDPEQYVERNYRTNVSVSVIVPCYNAEENLTECINSIQQQSLKNIEIICVDDGSTDKTRDILERKCKEDSRIITVYFDNNLGVSTARNVAMKKAKGEFIVFMDSDDWYPESDILQALYDSAKSQNVLICGGSFSEYDGTKVISTYEGSMSGYTFKENKKMTFEEYQFDFGFHRFLYNRELLINNNITFPNLKRYQDPPFFVEALSSVDSFYVISKIVYRYRRTKQMRWTVEKVIALNKGLCEVLRFSIDNGYNELYNLTLRRFETKFWKPNLEVFDSKNIDLIKTLTKLNELSRNKNRDYIWTILLRKSKIVSNENKKITEEQDDYYYGLYKGLVDSYSYRIGRYITFIPRTILKWKKR